MRKYPVGMVLSGRYYWSDGTLNSQGMVGFYWSSSVYTSATAAYDLVLNGTNSAVLPANYNLKRASYTLRCLAQKVNNNIENLVLPTGNTTGEFQSLYNQYPSYDQMRKYPVGMVLGGYYSWGDGTPGYQGRSGYFWSSSTSNSATNAYYLDLYVGNGKVTPAAGRSKQYGHSLRCLAQNQTKNKKPSRFNKKTK